MSEKTARKTRPQLLSDRGTVDATLRFIAQRGWKETDGDFFSALVTHLAESLGVAYALVDRVVEGNDGEVETVALYAHGAIAPNFGYCLPGSPCKTVLEQELCCYPAGVQQTFPTFGLLGDMHAESYAGIALWGDHDNPIGLIVIVDEKPLENVELVETLLQIVAMRASAELERRIMLEDLEFARQRFQDFASATSDWFWEMDENLRFCYFSDRFTEITGVNSEWLVGKNRQESGVEKFCDPEDYRKQLADLAAHRPFRNFIHGRRKPDGSLVHLAISGQPYFDEKGNFKGYRGNGRDITDQVETEMERDRALTEAQRANTAKSRFLANMSHDLRTPLNAILGFSDILREQMLGPLHNRKYLEYADDIHNSASYLLELVNDLLDISFIEAGKTKLSLEPVNVSDLIVDCFQNFAGRAAEKNLIIDTDVPEDLPPMMADKRAIKQVLLNLVTNAIKFTEPEGKISIQATATDRDCTITVADTGQGIEPERLPNITNPFTRGERNPLDSEQGWGLGLAIANALVGLHKGRLSIESALGKGTSVTISIPRQEDEPGLPFDQEQIAKAG
ncbi:PAS domain-containing sensor histidine kinase [Hwanghaeella grinnelliae]|uniref:histidine kinase n=1 Tax=Hwanghaeella grinnelliae TaxID=2500179 RepID=A0A437QW54_9PROT|nr:PAS domain-containing sensor histidine kinase [Hwanghaeella grinnelliae]RVU38767.1 PAS domain-containing sensor histidine kinase [Hwanghaeella grinnelliae]